MLLTTTIDNDIGFYNFKAKFYSTLFNIHFSVFAVYTSVID